MIGIIQFRTDDSLLHEQQCFDKHLSEFDLGYLSVFDDKAKVRDTKFLSETYDKLILAGSAELLLSRNDLKTSEARQTISPSLIRLIEEDFPVLGICFGHQLITEVLGGEIANKEEQAEGGQHQVRFTSQGRDDPLFGGLSDPSNVTEGHNDSVIKLPSEAKNLAFSQRCSNQALKVQKNVYGVQFHPELSHQDMLERWRLSVPFGGEVVEPDADSRNSGPNVLKNFVSMPTAV